jgi:integrase
MRPGEITRLMRGDILFNEGLIRVTASNSKTNRERYVPLTAPLAAELRRWLNFIAEDPVWLEAVPDKLEARIFGPAAEVTRHVGVEAANLRVMQQVLSQVAGMVARDIQKNIEMRF